MKLRIESKLVKEGNKDWRHTRVLNAETGEPIEGVCRVQFDHHYDSDSYAIIEVRGVDLDVDDVGAKSDPNRMK